MRRITVDRDAVTIYLGQMGLIPVLETEQEYRLCCRIEDSRRSIAVKALSFNCVFRSTVQLLQSTLLRGTGAGVLPSTISLREIKELIEPIDERRNTFGARHRLAECGIDFRHYELQITYLREAFRFLRQIESGEITSPDDVQLTANYLGLLNELTSVSPVGSDGLWLNLEDAYSRYLADCHLLASANCRLVVAVAKRYRNLGLPFADLIQEGNRGLLRALQLFEPRRGNKFATYATFWIRQSIIKALNSRSRMIRIPDHLVEVVRLLNAAYTGFMHEHGRRPTAEDLSDATDMSVAKVKKLLPISGILLSIDSMVDGASGNNDPHHKFMAIGGSDTDVTLTSTHDELAKVLAEKLVSLPYRESEVLKMIVGMNEDETVYTLETVGKRFGLSKERARQLKERGLNKLRQPRRSADLEPFLAH